MQTNANKCKQTNGGARQQHATEERTRGTTRQESTWQVLYTKRKGKGEWCERREENTRSKQKNRAIIKANNCDDIYPNKPVNIVFLLVFERTQAAPVYATNNRQFLSWKNMHYEVQAKQINTGKFANIGVSYIQAIFYALTG